MDSASGKSWPKGFWNLMFTQFQGAFSDNALRWLVIYVYFSSTVLTDQQQVEFIGNTGILLAVPFLLFSTVAGWLADRFSKRSVMIGVKLSEIGIMLFAAVGLALGRWDLQLAAIGLMGAHSTFFAPAKYGVMPEVLPAARLSAGNGVLELLTFIAIIVGTLAGGWLAETLGHRAVMAGLILAALAGVGLSTSLGVARVPAADPGKRFNWNIPGEIWGNLALMKKDRDLWRANWGNAAFFFVAALIQFNLALFAQQVFHLRPTEQSGLQAALSLGIGVGSMVAGKLSRGHIEYGLIPFGTGLMAIAGFGLGWPGITVAGFVAGLVVLGLGGGLFIVPIVSVLQHKPSPQMKGTVQGSVSWLSWAGIALASQVPNLLHGRLQLSYSQIFWVCGGIAAVAGIYVVRTRPHAVAQMLGRWKKSRA